MKLLFDQNISFRILKLLSKEFQNCKQVRLLGLENKSDLAIWNYAKKNNFCIVTFDSDFFDFSNIKGHPPKVIWLKSGNLTTSSIAKLLLKNSDLIEDFTSNTLYSDLSCLQLND